MKCFFLCFLSLFSQSVLFASLDGVISQEIDPPSPEEHLGSCCLFTGNANPELAEAVAKKLGSKLCKAKVSRFKDGEINVQLTKGIRNCDVYIMQSTCPTLTQSVNDHIMELFLMVRACRRASVRSVTAVIPYYGYARQDRKVISRVPISAADVALLLEAAGVDNVVAIDLHSNQIQGFFQNIPVDNLYASVIFVPYMAKKSLHNPVVVSPDAGGVARAKQFIVGISEHGMNPGMAVIIKQRSKPGEIESMNLVGTVEDSDVIIVDDMCDSGGTLVKAAGELKNAGARKVYACITHPVFSGDALEKIKNSVIDELIVTDTIPIEKEKPKNVTQLSVSSLLAEAIKRIQNGKSLSLLFHY